ncbi:hypothetical protein [Lignipirellula cremea]|uniref:Uncharacterized protein n=1 Tax=Lignipirellula cremea TaxID=2528010 RepID=A0A518DQC8_9BACT|nr:hypothetical protein [Lignipirellula cremea]QDU94022.1 hypothetical protein Pla8534_18080 [Lignipirellula cremea]
MFHRSLNYLAAALLCCPVVALADDAEPPADDAVFIETEPVSTPDLDDPAFSALVNLELLGAALAQGDAAAVTDVGLQLANAERSLLRSHPSLKSSAVLATASRLATSSGDKATLARLARAADLLNDETLQKNLATAIALGGASRRIDPAPSLAADIDPQVYAGMRTILDHLEIAENVGDHDGLVSLLVDVETLDASPELKAWLNQRIEKGLANASQADPDNAKAMSLLADASRPIGGFSFSPPPTPFKIRSPFGSRPAETQSNLGGPSGLVHPQQTRMQRMGYSTTNNHRLDQSGRMQIGNQTVQARRARNPATGRSAWVYTTKSGHKFVRRDGDSRTYVRSGN